MARMDDINFIAKKALIRVDFNVPLDDAYNVTDDTRIRAAIPTIKKILSDGGAVILMSHLGRPKGGPEPKYSLKHTIPTIEKLLGQSISFHADSRGESTAHAVQDLAYGEVLLLENLRFYKEEEKGDQEMARELASLGADFYINDAFGTAHRAHASTALIADYFPAEQRLFGYLMEAEVSNATKVLHEAKKPFVAILGGAKVSDKLLLIENLLLKADQIIVGGGMAYTFFKAQGGSIGKSLVEEDRLELALSLIAKAKERGVELVLPIDSVIADEFSPNAHVQLCNNEVIPDGWMGLDIGPQAISQFTKIIHNAKTILWNGPMGVFEMEKFENGTKQIAVAIGYATTQGAFSLVGGGDSVSAVNQFGLANEMSYISTGGGAMLEFFEGKKLPGIQSILGD